MPHKHAVWPTRVPPVATGRWGAASWEKFEDQYRPAGYKGGRHDAAAWAAFQVDKEEEKAASILASFGLDVASEEYKAKRAPVRARRLKELLG